MVHVHDDVVATSWHRRPEAAITTSGAEDHRDCLVLSRTDLWPIARPCDSGVVGSHHSPRPGLHDLGYQGLTGIHLEGPSTNLTDDQRRVAEVPGLDGSVVDDQVEDQSRGKRVASGHGRAHRT